MHIWCTYETTHDSDGKQCRPKSPKPCDPRSLRRPLKPSVTRDSEIPGLCLHVTTSRSFWALSYQPKGINPVDWQALGRRRALRTRRRHAHDRLRSPYSRAGGQSASSGQAEPPTATAMASRASAVAERGILPSTVAEALDAYAAALMTRRQPSEATRRKSIHYARKAVRLMKAESLALPAIDTRMVRLMVETMVGSDAERHLVFRGLNRFLAWSRKQGLIERNICDDLDRDEKPRVGQSRITSPRSRSCAPCGPPSRTKGNVISCNSCCSFRLGATKPPASRGARSICSCGASASRQTGRKRANPTNCHCRRRRWRCSRRASRKRQGESRFSGERR